MTRALCSKSSKRIPAKSNQNPVPQDCIENSPLITSQSTIRKALVTNKNSSEFKENISPKEGRSSRLAQSNCADVVAECNSPIRKSTRRNPFTINLNKSVKARQERTALCDKTNAEKVGISKLVEESSDVLKAVENNKYLVQKVNVTTRPNKNHSEMSVCPKDRNGENHVPIYKAVGSFELDSDGENVPPKKKEAVYEFEIDESEEPVHKKKPKKRPYTRKPKIGPKALTINNIKYSSSESLVSLPEKPVTKKKRIKRGMFSMKAYSSVTTLHESENTCSSLRSFMSHPPSILLSENDKIRSQDLSILQETQAENDQSPYHQVKTGVVDPVRSHSSLHSSLKSTNTHVNPKHNSNQVTVSVDVHVESHDNPPISLNSTKAPVYSEHNRTQNLHDIHFTPNPRCYVSKTSHSSSHNSENDSVPHQSIWSNISHVSSRDFLSSTPCKPSLLVRDNSVFGDDSCHLPVRPSTGFIKDASLQSSTTTDNYFGFDEPEELEEPLVSPIKNNIDLQSRRIIKVVPCRLGPSREERFKPSVEEVLEMLKATIPKAAPNETSDDFNISSKNNLSTLSVEIDTTQPTEKFTLKPPRRSYERQRRIRHNSEPEVESDSEEKIQEENLQSTIKKCYKKINSSKASKPSKTTKKRQKITKEEEEIERLAAQMNAQFQEIEKVNLVVE